jgi:two-component sensor histidine kinase
VTTKDAGASVDELLDSSNLAQALESDRFRHFLDHIPFGIAVADLPGSERITYANPEFERLTGLSVDAVTDQTWAVVEGSSVLDADGSDEGQPLAKAIVDREEYLGIFEIGAGADCRFVDVWSNLIENDDSRPVYRLVAIAETMRQDAPDGDDLRQQLEEKDTLLRELQHRVKNNLQMITALIRLEARAASDSKPGGEAFERLAGRIQSLSLLYNSLENPNAEGTVDLGTYLGEIASNVMKAHAVGGIRLALEVDSWPVSVNVAMPAGLVVNELMTNALKYAFVGREGGTITIKSLVDKSGCTVTVADNGIGLQDGAEWPRAGKLSALIVHSLRENAKAKVTVDGRPGEGMQVTLFFKRRDAEPGTAA